MNCNIDRLELGGVFAYITDVTFKPRGIVFTAIFEGPHDHLRGPVTIYTSDGEVFPTGIDFHEVPSARRWQRTFYHYRINTTMFANHNLDYEMS